MIYVDGINRQAAFCSQRMAYFYLLPLPLGEARSMTKCRGLEARSIDGVCTEFVNDLRGIICFVCFVVPPVLVIKGWKRHKSPSTLCVSHTPPAYDDGHMSHQIKRHISLAYDYVFEVSLERYIRAMCSQTLSCQAAV